MHSIVSPAVFEDIGLDSQSLLDDEVRRVVDRARGRLARGLTNERPSRSAA